MKQTTIDVPLHLTVPSLLRWSEQLWIPGNEVDIEINFSGSRFFTPFSMVFLVQQIEGYYKNNPAARLRYTNLEQCEWASNMNLFATLQNLRGGSDDSSNIRVIDSNSIKYLPLTTLDTAEFKKQNGRGLDEINEAVDAESTRLTKALTQLGSGSAFDTIQYSLREIMRNVFEHSGAKSLRYCAQFYPRNRVAELIVADNGWGIHSSITGNPNYKDLPPREAIHLACMPGVSGNAAALRERVPTNPWRNTGYGLYMTSRLCRNNGDFMIVSSNRVLSLTEIRKNNFPITNCYGTVIRLHLNLQDPSSLRDKLATYAAEGRRIAEDIYGAKVLDASAASQLLRRDFSS